MPEATPYERLQPCLLDRLTDEDPRSKTESRAHRVVTLRQYRDAVGRDLSWLFNSCARPDDDPIYEHPEVARSVLNYGIPDLCGLTTGAIEPAELERRVRQAILAFEPRILRNTLSVRVIVDDDQTSRNAMALEIAGELWAQPASESLYIRTEVDLETGSWAL
jgi:type VI secretion system protein ImpF